MTPVRLSDFKIGLMVLSFRTDGKIPELSKSLNNSHKGSRESFKVYFWIPSKPQTEYCGISIGNSTHHLWKN